MMSDEQNEMSQGECSTAGKGFARTQDTAIAPESCGLPERGFGLTNAGKKASDASCGCGPTDCSTAGMGFARTDKTKIAPEDCANPSRGFATVDTGK
ncbi:hypothetical protein SAMN04490178_12447 [Propionispora vibrioides]|uniref:Uncharacterized protein n=2 Tax=Propionispora vibrioides TaxID=112903 RepID=A0A1H8XIF3_9FIRM|nr:hypothetical protein SAMN04490178_12447 [Propionispora vibrioides]